LTTSNPSRELAGRAWQDPQRGPDERVGALIEAMTLWVGTDPDGPGVAPHQTELENGQSFEEVIASGLGQLTRAAGSPSTARWRRN
jgi:hypothetical protein